MVVGVVRVLCIRLRTLMSRFDPMLRCFLFNFFSLVFFLHHTSILKVLCRRNYSCSCSSVRWAVYASSCPKGILALAKLLMCSSAL